MRQALTDAELVAHARSFLGELDNAFARHDYSSLASTVGQAMLAQLCADAGQPDLLLDLISGLGDVESASPSSGLWDLSRTVNASGELRALFDQGAAAVAAALNARPRKTLDWKTPAEALDALLQTANKQPVATTT